MVAKSTAKKPVKKVTKTATVTKKPVAKKTVAKISTTKPAAMKSFKVYRDGASFREFKISRQTVYWIVLLLVIISLQLWVISIQLQIESQLTIPIDQ